MAGPGRLTISLSLALLGLSGSYSPPTWNERVMTIFLAEP